MSTEREKLIAKIKKCMRLARSSNEHEAAIALRQAQKMMAEHGITENDVIASEASEVSTPSGAARKPPRWEVALAGIVGDAFGCHVIHMQGYKNFNAFATWNYVGVGAAPELASYTFAVMFRQLKKARSAHIDKKLSRCKQTTRTRRADLFCEGWVTTVASQIRKFANDGVAQAAITAFMKNKHPALGSLQVNARNEGRQLSEREYGDYAAGSTQGRAADLRRPMGAPMHEALE
jgi:hypothetical protein